GNNLIQYFKEPRATPTPPMPEPTIPQSGLVHRSAPHFRIGHGESAHEWTVQRAENPALAEDTEENAE
ncbi:MAG: hypothetical protein M3Y07_11165, partial [Acidobacteriota bacterium]|nr:hypothetical protein [Acidobacteriota bacterium]